MRRKMRFSLGAFVCGVMLLAAGCGHKEKKAAQEAINAAQATINEVQEEAKKYVPEQLHNAQTTLQHAKDTLQNGDYPAALSAAQDALNKAKAVASKTLEQQEQWTNLKDSITKSLDEMKAKLDAYAKGEHLPKGMTKSKLKEAQKEYEQLKQKWDETWAGSRGEVSKKVEELKEQVEKLKKELGIE